MFLLIDIFASRLSQDFLRVSRLKKLFLNKSVSKRVWGSPVPFRIVIIIVYWTIAIVTQIVSLKLFSPNKMNEFFSCFQSVWSTKRKALHTELELEYSSQNSSRNEFFCENIYLILMIFIPYFVSRNLKLTKMYVFE